MAFRSAVQPASASSMTARLLPIVAIAGLASASITPVRADVFAQHKATLSFIGPQTAESDEVNPFTDYRLLVTFRHGDESVVVRGFYAADGNAAQSHATSGNVWQARFAPPHAGTWLWSAELRRGTDIAINDDVAAGERVALQNSAGRLEVMPTPAATPATGDPRDLRRQPGSLRADGHYFRFGADGPRVLKMGANSPENLLAYSGFDGTYRTLASNREGEAKTTKTLHAYKPHAEDWRNGDPTWDGQGRSLIGAINYLASTGMNSVYFLTMNIGGDGNDVWPYATPDDFTRFDCSKLDQWEIVFDHMQHSGLILQIVTQETENETLLDNGDVGRLRRLYYRELIARFAHHPALIWNLGEENGPAPFSPNGQTAAQQKAMADEFAAHDPYGHPVVIHSHASREHQDSVLADLLGHKTLDGLSQQIGQPAKVHAWIADWRRRSAAARQPWVVSMDEIGRYNIGALPDSVDPEHNSLREQVLWGALMAGAGGVEWYFGSEAPHTDLTCEDWRSRDTLWKQTQIAASFFQDHLPYWRMRSAEDLVTGGKAYALASQGEVYSVYRFSGAAESRLKLDLADASGVFRVRWQNPRADGGLEMGTVAQVTAGAVVDLGLPPADPGQDWVILLTR